MAKIFTEEEIRKSFNAMTDRGEPIVISDVGAGITAKFAQAGGADMIAISACGYWRMDNIGSIAGIMPFDNSNDILLRLTDRVMPRVKNVPACAGIAGPDPTRELEPFLEDLRRYGYSAVINSPTMGYVTGSFRDNVENANLGVREEIVSLKKAGEMGFFTIANAYDEDTASLAAELGIDALVANLGPTEQDGRKTTLEQAAEKINRLAGAALQLKQDMIVLAHGGCILTPEDTAYIYRHTPAVGFYGESVLETVPATQPMIDAVRAFRNAKFAKKEGK